MDFHYIIMKTHAQLSKQIAARAQKELGLSPGQPKVLDCLIGIEGSDQKTLAAACEIEQATLGSLLLRMEKKGLIERRQLPGNRRSLFVYLTEEGREKAKRMKQIFDEEDQKALQGLHEEQRKQLLKNLESICAEMTKREKENIIEK